jgi:hypothetical protein
VGRNHGLGARAFRPVTPPNQRLRGAGAADAVSSSSGFAPGPLNLALGGRGAKEGQAGGAGPTRPWTDPMTRVRRPAGVDTAKVRAFLMLFTRLSGVARQGRKATPGEAHEEEPVEESRVSI